MTISIRRGELSDGPALAALQQRTWRETYLGLLPVAILDGLESGKLARLWRAELARQDKDFDHGVFIAHTSDGQAVGYATCGSASQRAQGLLGQGEIHQVYVRASHQRRGIGRGLLLACSRWMLMRGMFSGGLWVVRGNHDARAFYRNLGGIVVGERRDPMQGWLIPVVAYRWDELEAIAGVSSIVPGWH